MTGYVRSVVRGTQVELDAVGLREIKAALQQPLAVWLLRLTHAGYKVRGSRGNMPRDVIEVIEKVRVSLNMSKLELARRSGVSRGHIQALLVDPNPQPHLETVVRLAIGLDFQLELVDKNETPTDDADPVMPGAEDRARAASWQQAGAFGASMFGGSVLPMLLGGRGAAYAGLGLLGAATIGLAVGRLDAPRQRETVCFVGAGFVAAAAFGYLCGVRRPTPHGT